MKSKRNKISVGINFNPVLIFLLQITKVSEMRKLYVKFKNREIPNLNLEISKISTFKSIIQRSVNSISRKMHGMLPLNINENYLHKFNDALGPMYQAS